jgi:hypothetical protein
MMAAYGPLSVGLFFVNPMINAGNANYLDYYL